VHFLGTHELGQKEKSSGYQSYSIQQMTIYQTGQSLGGSSQVFQFHSNCQVNISLLDEISNKEMMTWASFSKRKLFSAIESYNNLF